MTDPDRNTGGLREHPESELTQYRPVSLLALGALGCGLLSITAFAYPLLWIVPLVGIAIGAIALWRLKHAEQPMLGGRMALAGLLLSIVFGIAAPTQRMTHDYWIGSRAKRIAEQFFDLIQTDPARAYQLMFRSHQKAAPPERAVDGEPPQKPKSDLETFLGEAPVAALIKLGPRLRRESIGMDMLPLEGGRQQMYVAYEIRDSGDPAAPPRHISIFELRNFDSQGNEHWYIMSLSKLQGPGLAP